MRFDGAKVGEILVLAGMFEVQSHQCIPRHMRADIPGANPVHAWNAAARHPPHEASETGIRHRCRPTREKRSRVGHVRVETVVLMLEPVALSAADAIHAVTRSCVSSAAARTTKVAAVSHNDGHAHYQAVDCVPRLSEPRGIPRCLLRL